MVNTAKVKMPEDYHVPEYVTKGRAKDFAMAYWLTKEIGVVAMYSPALSSADRIDRPRSSTRINIESWRMIG